MMSFSTAASERSESDHVEYIDDDSKFKIMIDEIGNKNSKTSVPALKFVFTKMQQMPMTSLLASQKLTLSTELYRALRKVWPHSSCKNQRNFSQKVTSA